MKKIYTIITTLLLAVLTANAQTVLINEDFSGLTAGTEDNPDATMLVDDMGDFINPSALKPYDSGLSYKKWGGIGLYSAGGCIAIKDGWFLNTPAGDMSGDVTITFRARLAKGQDDTGRNALDLIFLSRKGLVDFGRKTYSLTEEWQLFSFSSDRGNFETTGFQFFANTEATILGTLIDAALSEADFIVYKGIRSDQVSAVCIDMERYIINRAAKSICQIFCQDIFSRGLWACKKKIFSFQKSCNGHFQDFFSVERYRRSGNSGCSPLINVIIFSKLLDTVDQAFGNALFF